MERDVEIQRILDNLKIFDKMYEIIRFIDPVSKKVIHYKNSTVSELEIRCFDFWEKNSICDNCISMRAFNENHTFVKIEYTPEKVYMITAIPIELNNSRIVVELFKDTTNSMVFGNGSYEINTEIHNLIDNFNNIAVRDDLTGLYNRRYINEKLPVDLINAVISEKNISIIMTDIDFFKKANDTYGHLAGDLVLKVFSGTLLEGIKRETDWVSRYGGEEFLICLPGAGVDRASQIAENMRKAVEKKEVIFGDNTIKVTASFGVCSLKPVQGSSIEGFIECADKKLYSAKNNGRNRVEW